MVIFREFFSQYVLLQQGQVKVLHTLEYLVATPTPTGQEPVTVVKEEQVLAPDLLLQPMDHLTGRLYMEAVVDIQV